MVFWDLDGPILDVTDKYYSVYKEILLGNNDTPLPKNDYWELKRSITPIEDILAKSNSRIPAIIFKNLWIERIETKKYLKLDKLQPDSIEILNDLRENNSLVMVTLRSTRRMLLKQLENLNLIQYFDKILSSGVDIKPRWKIKYGLIKNYMGNTSNNHTLIGDTETDIEAGNHLGFQTIAISNGIRNETILINSKPDYIYSSTSDFFIHHNFSRFS